MLDIDESYLISIAGRNLLECYLSEILGVCGWESQEAKIPCSGPLKNK